MTENVKFLKNQDLSKSLKESLRRLGDSPCISKNQMIQDYQLYMYCMQYSFNVKRQPLCPLYIQKTCQGLSALGLGDSVLGQVYQIHINLNLIHFN